MQAKQLQNHKNALAQIFKQMEDNEDDEDEKLLLIPMDKQQFEESQIKLGNKIFVQVKLAKKDESKKID